MLANKPKLDIRWCYYCVRSKGVRKEGDLGLNPPLSLAFYKKFIAYAKEIYCFPILFAC